MFELAPFLVHEISSIHGRTLSLSLFKVITQEHILIDFRERGREREEGREKH